ncbi:MAG: thioredoxin domain-containing protein [Vicinamibacterales bacterium]
MNRLAGSPSPYLRQHAANPVHWYPWGEEAFAAARRLQRPIFLSIGYATCHWCHVMAHESFEDAATATDLNREFVAIKLDREERPDLDRVYMAFVQASTGGGGWPLSVWLTPSLEPFYGGTYFPPTAAWGRPSFRDVLREVARAWRDDRAGVESSARRAVAALRVGPPRVTTGVSADAALEAGQEAWARAFDERHGGFGDGPKFPRPSELLFLLREHARTGAPEPRVMALGTLRAMALGGLRDHVGGGFHRYAVDGAWRVPHFEKMLYDQALLVIAYLEAFQVSGDPFFAQVAEDTLRYVERDLLSPEGLCWAAEDADSVPGEAAAGEGGRATEGAFYLWTRQEIVETLGPDSRVWERRFGVEPGGNLPFDPQGEFGPRNHFYTAATLAAVAGETGLTPAEVGAALARGRQRLFDARRRRPRPSIDDAAVTAWNGLMLAAFARAAGVLAADGVLDAGHAGTGDRHRRTAERLAEALRERVWDAATRRLSRRVAGGEAGVAGVAEDYACLAWGLVELFQVTGSPEWLAWAVELHETLDARFLAEDDRGWYATTGEDATVLVRQIDEHDGAEPSATAVAAATLLSLSRLTGHAAWQQRAERVLTARLAGLARAPRAAPHMLAALSTTRQPSLEIVVTAGDEARAASLRNAVRARFLPGAVVVPVSPASAEALASMAPWTRAYAPAGKAPAAYVCQSFVCAAPVTDDQALAVLLDDLLHPGPPAPEAPAH